jgi:diadenosine tetraphosphate (Ap4A) HIT family hydrolase
MFVRQRGEAGVGRQGCRCSPVFEDSVVFRRGLITAIWDGFAVRPGDTLIFARRHSAAWDGLTDAEKAACWSAIRETMADILARQAQDGFAGNFKSRRRRLADGFS